MQVLLNDIHPQYLELKTDIDSALQTAIDTCQFIGGNLVTSFEEDFAKYNDSSFCVGCANGTDAIEIALQGLGIEPGDEVIVPAITWISTAGAVRNVGAIPIFADVDENHILSISDTNNKITDKTKAIIIVHLFGKAAEVSKFSELAKKHQIKIIEDSAQAHGAEVDGGKVGTLADAGTFSFYPGKNLGAFGDAGAIVTNNKNVAETCKMIGNHGQVKKHNHLRAGRNSRLDSIQASILSIKLTQLDRWNQRRIDIAQQYGQQINNPKITLPEITADHSHVYHLFVVQCDERDALQKHLRKCEVQTAVHYPTILPKTPTFNTPGDFPVATAYSQTCLSIPMSPSLSDEEVLFVIDSINSFGK